MENFNVNDLTEAQVSEVVNKRVCIVDCLEDCYETKMLYGMSEEQIMEYLEEEGEEMNESLSYFQV